MKTRLRRWYKTDPVFVPAEFLRALGWGTACFLQEEHALWAMEGISKDLVSRYLVVLHVVFSGFSMWFCFKGTWSWTLASYAQVIPKSGLSKYSNSQNDTYVLFFHITCSSTIWKEQWSKQILQSRNGDIVWGVRRTNLLDACHT